MDFNFINFSDYVKPILWTIAGIGLFVGLVTTAFGVMTTKGKSEERGNFFSDMIWIITGAFIISSGSAIASLFFK